MTNIVFQIGNVISYLVSFGIDSVSSFSSCIRSYPLLLAFVVLSLVGLGVGFIKRIIHL